MITRLYRRIYPRSRGGVVTAVRQRDILRYQVRGTVRCLVEVQVMTDLERNVTLIVRLLLKG